MTGPGLWDLYREDLDPGDLDRVVEVVPDLGLVDLDLAVVAVPHLDLWVVVVLENKDLRVVDLEGPHEEDRHNNRREDHGDRIEVLLVVDRDSLDHEADPHFGRHCHYCRTAGTLVR